MGHQIPFMGDAGRKVREYKESERCMKEPKSKQKAEMIRQKCGIRREHSQRQGQKIAGKRGGAGEKVK